MWEEINLMHLSHDICQLVGKTLRLIKNPSPFGCGPVGRDPFTSSSHGCERAESQSHETAPLGQNCRVKPFLPIKALSCNRHQNKLTIAIYFPFHLKTPLQMESI